MIEFLALKGRQLSLASGHLLCAQNATESLRRTNIIDDTGNASDCDGHGTTVGGIALGRNVGVAKEASLVAVRVLDCQVR